MSNVHHVVRLIPHPEILKCERLPRNSGGAKLIWQFTLIRVICSLEYHVCGFITHLSTCNTVSILKLGIKSLSTIQNKFAEQNFPFIAIAVYYAVEDGSCYFVSGWLLR